MRVSNATRAPACLSRLRCDQLLNGELATRDANADVAHAACCARCAALVAEHRRERARFAVRLGVARPWLPRAAVATTLAAAAVLAFWLVGRREPEAALDTRSKGKPTLGFYVKHGDAIRRGGPGEIVAPGDAINFSTSSDRAAFLAIVSIDGAARVSVYYPDAPVTARLAAGRDRLLPRSVVLDGVLGTERLYGAFCDRPLAVAQLAAAITRGAALPGGCVLDSLTVEKRAP